MTDIKNILDNAHKKEKWKNIANVSKLMLVFILIGFSFLFFLTKSSIEVEGEVVFVSLVASQGTKNFKNVFFETKKGFKGVVKLPQYSNIEIGDKILCNKTQNYMGQTRHKFIKKL